MIFDLFIFSDIFWLVLIGNFAHLLIKWTLAIRKPEYGFKMFFNRNITGFLAGILLSQAYAFVASRGDNMPPLADFIGYGLMGSSLGKNILKHMDNELQKRSS